MTRNCLLRKKCEINGCQRFHHTLLHADPPTASGVASVLDNNGILPVVRVSYSWIREGNVLIDSGATCSRVAMSQNIAIELMENSCKRRGDRYIVGLPWKKDKSLLPNNNPLVEKRKRRREEKRKGIYSRTRLKPNCMIMPKWIMKEMVGSTA